MKRWIIRCEIWIKKMFVVWQFLLDQIMQMYGYHVLNIATQMFIIQQLLQQNNKIYQPMRPSYSLTNSRSTPSLRPSSEKQQKYQQIIRNIEESHSRLNRSKVKNNISINYVNRQPNPEKGLQFRANITFKRGEKEGEQLLKKVRAKQYFRAEKAKEVNNKPFMVNYEKQSNKIKQLENQLSFEQRYANQQYKSAQEAKKKILELQIQNNSLAYKLKQKEEIENNLSVSLNQLSQYKQKFIFLQIAKTSLETQNKTINEEYQKLKNKMENFDQCSKNDIYQGRIKQMREEIYKLKEEVNQAVIEKTKIKEINTQLMYITNLPQKKQSIQTGHQYLQTFNETIKSYISEIDLLKSQIEQLKQQCSEISSKLSEEKIKNSLLQEQKAGIILKQSISDKNQQHKYTKQKQQKSLEIKDLQNKLRIIESKYENELNTVKEKDSFIEQMIKNGGYKILKV